MNAESPGCTLRESEAWITLRPDVKYQSRRDGPGAASCGFVARSPCGQSTRHCALPTTIRENRASHDVHLKGGEEGFVRCSLYWSLTRGWVTSRTGLQQVSGPSLETGNDPPTRPRWTPSGLTMTKVRSMEVFTPFLLAAFLPAAVLLHGGEPCRACGCSRTWCCRSKRWSRPFLPASCRCPAQAGHHRRCRHVVPTMSYRLDIFFASRSVFKEHDDISFTNGASPCLRV